MPQGSCVCGEYTYSLVENPSSLILCHCKPCQKLAGPNGSVNAAVPVDQYKRLTGNVKKYIRKGISGKDVQYEECATCGCVMVVEPEAMSGMYIVKPGTLDDVEVLNAAKPAMEIFTKDRPACFTALPGVAQKEVS